MADGKHFKHRYGLKRFKQSVAKFTAQQRGFVVKHGFGSLLHLSDFSVPIKLTEWIMSKIEPDLCEFRHRNRVIVFNKSIVEKILGLSSGQLHVNLSGTSEDVVELRNMYRGKEIRLFIERCAHMVENFRDEENFIRTFFLFALSTVYCPGTGNYVNLEYLHSLLDISNIRDYDWASHILDCLMNEVKKYQGFSKKRRKKDFWIGECLPILSIAYMDHLKLPRHRPKDHVVSYELPRICNISNADFRWVASMDKNKMGNNVVSFGYLPFRDTKEIPYYFEAQEEHQNEELASLDDSLHRSGSSSQRSQLPASIQDIIQKHDQLWGKEVDATIETFSNSMKLLHSKRTAALVSEVMAWKGAVSYGSDITLDPLVPPRQPETRNAGTSNNADGGIGKFDAMLTLLSVIPEEGEQIVNVQSNSPGPDAPSKSTRCQYSDIDILDNRVDTDTGNDCGVKTPSPSPSAATPSSPSPTAPSPSAVAAPPSTIETIPPSDQVIEFKRDALDTCGASTHEKKNRKKRAKKVIDEGKIAKKMKVSSDVEDMYKKFLSRRFIKKAEKNKDQEPFISIGRFYVGYDHFYEALKPRGKLSNEVMYLWTEMFNNESKEDANIKSSVKKGNCL